MAHKALQVPAPTNLALQRALEQDRCMRGSGRVALGTLNLKP